jgi:MoaA/NifB/PqqE/SkfB family radical SAM enzyme
MDRSGELTIAEWLTVRQKLRAFGVCALVFTGGEPLVKKVCLTFSGMPMS